MSSSGGVRVISSRLPSNGTHFRKFAALLCLQYGSAKAGTWRCLTAQRPLVVRVDLIVDLFTPDPVYWHSACN